MKVDILQPLRHNKLRCPKYHSLVSTKLTNFIQTYKFTPNFSQMIKAVAIYKELIYCLFNVTEFNSF